MSILSDNIDKVLKEKGLTPYQVSLAAGKNKQFIADILAGRAKSTSYENLVELARTLDVPLSHLTGETSGDPAPDLDAMLACFGWVLENFDKLRDIDTTIMIDELKIQFTRMQKDNIRDKREAVRITSYLFDSLLAKAKLTLKPPPRRSKNK